MKFWLISGGVWWQRRSGHLPFTSTVKKVQPILRRRLSWQGLKVMLLIKIQTKMFHVLSKWAQMRDIPSSFLQSSPSCGWNVLMPSGFVEFLKVTGHVCCFFLSFMVAVLSINIAFFLQAIRPSFTAVLGVLVCVPVSSLVASCLFNCPSCMQEVFWTDKILNTVKGCDLSPDVFVYSCILTVELYLLYKCFPNSIMHQSFLSSSATLPWFVACTYFHRPSPTSSRHGDVKEQRACTLGFPGLGFKTTGFYWQILQKTFPWYYIPCV